MATDALADGFDELMWIDADVGFEPADVDKLRQHLLPFVCGIYPKKGPREMAAHVFPRTTKLTFGVGGGLAEFQYVGFGFVHTRREVYTKMQKKLKLPVCNEMFLQITEPRPSGSATPPGFVAGEGSRPAQVALPDGRGSLPRSPLTVPYFLPLLHKVQKGHWYLGEDYSFCERAHQCGSKSWPTRPSV